MKLKKIAALALAGVMAVSMLAGCATNKPGEKPGEGEGEGTVTTTGYSAELEDAVELTDDQAKFISFKDNATDQAALEKAVEQLSASTLEKLAKRTIAKNIVYADTAADAKDMMEVYKKAVDATNGDLVLANLSMSGLVDGKGTNDYSHDLCTAAMFAVNGTVPTAAAMKAIAENVQDEIDQMVEKAASNGINFEYTYVVSVSAVTKTLQPAYTDASNSVTIFAVNVSRDATMVD